MSRTVLRAESSPACIGHCVDAPLLLLLLLLLHREGDANALWHGYVNGRRSVIARRTDQRWFSRERK